MYEIDPDRLDLIAEYDANPGGPYSHALTMVVNRLRLGPPEERYILICTRRGREWAVGKLPTQRGQEIELVAGAVFDNYDDAARKVFRLRWQAATGQELA